MRLLPLPRPVSVLLGLGHPHRIDTVDAALGFLQELPSPLRDEAHAATLATCIDALRGVATAEEAHDVFSAFARRRAILVEEEWPGARALQAA